MRGAVPRWSGIHAGNIEFRGAVGIDDDDGRFHGRRSSRRQNRRPSRKTCACAVRLSRPWLGWSLTAQVQFYDSGDDFGGDFSGSRETQAIVIINADGTAVLNVTSVDARTTVEQRLRMMEQYKNRQDSADDENDTPAQPAPQSVSTNNTQPFTDEEISKKLTEWMEERDANSGKRVP